MEKRIRDQGFHVRLAEEEQDVKRLLSVYYQQDVTTDRFEDWRRREGGDGPWLKKFRTKTNKRVPSKPSEPRVKDFLDLIAPTRREVQHGPLHLRRDLPLHLALRTTPPAPRSWLCSAAWGKRAA